MKLEYGDPRTAAMLTNVGLISSNGSYGYNIMACEWTHQISNDPGLFCLAIRNFKATYHNILETKVFGINIAAADQNILASVAGKTSAKKLEKISVLKELGIQFYNGAEIDVLMIEGACLSAECRLIRHIDIGDHPLLVGEVLSIKTRDKEPLIYHLGKYFHVGEQIQKPEEDVLQKIETLKQKYTKV